MSAPDASSSTVQPTEPRRWRFRFTLRTFLLTFTLLFLAVSHFYTSWQLRQARIEIRKLRHEIGYLTIADPSRLHAAALKSAEELTWRWRVYVPEGRRFRLQTALHNRIPADGLPRPEIRTALSAGEDTLTVTVRRNDRGEWKLSVLGPTGGAGTTISEDRMQWLVGPNHSLIGTSAGVRETECAVEGKPLVLLRMRAMKPTPGGGAATDFLRPTDGIMIWVDEGDPSE